MKRVNGHPSELEYFANKTQYDFESILARNRKKAIEHGREFEIARNIERCWEEEIRNYKERR